jgi:DNA polymerase III alpha subunit
MSDTARYPCGCQFPLDQHGKVIFDPTIEKIPLDCPETWKLLCNGDTKGIFQLESHLGKSLSKQVMPHSIEELSDIVAIMRPGCLEAIVDGKTLTNHYIDRKHGREDVTYYHSCLEPILRGTYGILVYQEQAMQIAQVVAGFNLLEADNLRKAIGKKKPEEMAKVKIMFLEKAIALGLVTETEAIEIFSWIEKSQRYSFNKSHSVAYAVNGYISAYAKAHFMKEFFTSYLVYSENEAKPSEEVKEVVSNAKRSSVDVYPPDIRKRNHRFRLIDDVIYTGISNIKGIGVSVLKDLEVLIPEKERELNKPIDKWTWLEFLLHVGWNLKKDAVISMISTGALSFFKVSRRKMLYEHEKLIELSDRDISWILRTPGDSLLERLKVISVGPVGKAHALYSKKGKEKVDNIITQLEKPPYSLEDSALWISEMENSMLGVALTCSKVDDCDSSSANCTCKDFLDGKGGYILIACNVEQVKEHAIKNGPKKGQKMAFLRISDSSCSIENVIVFPEQWEQCRDVIMEGTTAMIGGSRDRKNNDTLVVNKAWSI